MKLLGDCFRWCRFAGPVPSIGVDLRDRGQVVRRVLARAAAVRRSFSQTEQLAAQRGNWRFLSEIDG